MSLVEMQSCLARLYVSEGYRSRFYDDPDAAMGSYHLAPDERAAIRDVDRRMLEVFASTLITKRERRAMRAYAASFTWHGSAMHALFRRFLEMHGAPTRPTVHHETVSFGRFAEETLADRERFPAAAGDLIRFERAAYEATFLQQASNDGPGIAPGDLDDQFLLGTGILVEKFEYDVVSLDSALREAAARAGSPETDGEPEGEAAGITKSAPAGGTEPVEPVPFASTIVFRPGRGAGDQRLVRVNVPTALIIRRLDGRRTARDVARQVEHDLGAADLEDQVLDALHRLQQMMIVSVRPRRLP